MNLHRRIREAAVIPARLSTTLTDLTAILGRLADTLDRIEKYLDDYDDPAGRR